jgi:hypothetical protein
VSAVATFVLAVAALYQVREMRSARIAQQQPHVIVDADYSQHSVVKIVVRNIGLGAAQNITFKFSAPLESSIPHPSDPAKPYVVSDLPPFKKGIDYLAPGGEIPFGWDIEHQLMELLEKRGLQEGITVTSSYQDLQGRKYQTSWSINPLQLGLVIDFNQKGMNELVKVAEKIHKKL